MQAGPITVGQAQRATGETTRHLAHRIQLARAAWLGLIILTVAFFVGSLPAYHDRLATLCGGTSCPRGQLTAEGLRAHQALGISLGTYAAYVVALRVASAVVFVAVAGVIAWHKALDWLALLVALVLVTGSASPAAAALTEVAPVWRVARDVVEAVPLAGLVAVLFLFPDGRVVPRWGWVPTTVFIAETTVTVLFPKAVPSIDRHAILDNLVFFGCLGCGVAAQVYRYRRVSGPVERQQTKWVVCGLAAVVGGALAIDLLNGVAPAVAPVTAVADVLIVLLIPLSVGVALLRHRLWDLDGLINRTLVYGLLTAGVVGLYVLVVGVLGSLVHAEGSLALSLAATGLVAVLFQPVRNRLQRGVDRLLYGERDDPYAVLSRLGRRLEATLAPEAALPTIVETVAQALRLPYAAIALRGDDGLSVAASYGTPVPKPLRLPLVYHQETIGDLLLAPRAPGEAFAPADRRLLDDLARQTGIAAHAVRLTADLRRSRERLVTAREEERRRLRRDLHDGLGPMLGSLTLKLDVAGDLVEPDPAAARALLVDLKTQARSAIGDIRRLVYALRPPALDDLGLAAALSDAAAQYAHDGLRVTIATPPHLPPLPAAVEVAVYRITQEALTNVARHASASTCAVRLAVDDTTGEVRVEIADDGCGLLPGHGRGVGLTSMRERAEELGGTLAIASIPGEGTRIVARVPLPTVHEG